VTSLRILITNDDGVDAPGLAVMEAIARELSDDVWVCAPDGNQSGASHRFTFGRELELIEKRARVFAVAGGSPADCVVAGMTFLLKDRPADIVLSGVNNGQNLGDIINCSGTAAGAREGAFQGALGIAMSQGVNYEVGEAIDWDVSRQFGAKVVEGIRTEGAPGAWFNVNFPFCPPDNVEGVRVVPAQRFARSPMRYYASDNVGKFFIAIPETPKPLEPDKDFQLLMHGNAITVTPVALQGSDIAMAARMDGRIRL
jgi:5'-nucleotidase